MKMEFRVTYIRHYETFREMLESEEVERVLPGTESVQAGVEKYRSFSGYARRVKEHGVYAIGIERR